MSRKNTSSAYNSSCERSHGSLSRTVLLGAALAAQRRRRRGDPGLGSVLLFWAFVALVCWLKWG
jgi:hypothetical protein